jgi:hypothetical protein
MSSLLAVYGAVMAASIVVGCMLLTNTMLGVDQAQQPRLVALMAAMGAASLVLLIVGLAT